MGFQFAGSLSGAAPIVRRYQIGETMYVGQLVMPGTFTLTHGGHVQIADVANTAYEETQPLIGIVTAVADKSRTYVAASSGAQGYGDRSTYTITQATIAANLGTGLSGGGEVDVTKIVPFDTLVKGPIYNTVWGTALTELVVTTADSGGTTITAAGDAITDMTDAFPTAYCRSGANRGHYRVVTTTDSTTVSTVVIPFPYGIVAGDVFVVAACRLGWGSMQLCTGADAIDGDIIQTHYHPVDYHEINLEESGKEYAVFSTIAGFGAPA